MLGGGTGGAAAFAPHAQALANDFRVVRPQSLRIERIQSKQPLPPGYAIKTESAALARSLDQLGLVEPVDLVGHSFGALVALDFALDRPDRVRSLLLAEPPAFWVVPPEELRSAEEMRGMVELLRTFGPADEPTDEQLVQFQSRLGRKGVKPPAPGQPGWEDWVSRRSALRGLSAVANHTDEPGRLKTLRLPVLIVTGEDTVEFHRRINDLLAANLPTVERVELPGGHSAPVTAIDKFLPELRAFLTRRS
jgi:pimeloyl-ACP methyl ester carboxylesterase